jgi:hypothetical protein
MCVYLPDAPYAIPLEEHYTWNNNRILTYSLLLTKVTELRNNVHQTSGFSYPLRQGVYDQNAIVGDHKRALHFGSTPDSAKSLLNGYGSHRLAVIPARKVWDPVHMCYLHDRCWHSYGASVWFCYDCEGYKLDVVTDPAFWKDLKLGPGYFSKELINSVWHKQKILPGR